MDKVFKNNPNLKVYYKTTDGTAFYHESDAKLHAKSLKDKNIECIKRTEISEQVLENSEQEAEDKAKQEAEDKAKQEAKAAPKTKQVKLKQK